MIRKRTYENRVEVLQGTLDMLILKTLQWGPQHGYGIVQALRANSGEMLQIETGSLYPALHRLERNHSCYMPELERRVKFEEAISAKRRGWHSPFRTICAAGFWKPMRQEREAFAPWRHSSASVGGTARRSVCSRCAAARSVVRRSGGMVLSAA